MAVWYVGVVGPKFVLDSFFFDDYTFGVPGPASAGSAAGPQQKLLFSGPWELITLRRGDKSVDFGDQSEKLWGVMLDPFPLNKLSIQNLLHMTLGHTGVSSKPS